jgi:hypothetical protein
MRTIAVLSDVVVHLLDEPLLDEPFEGDDFGVNAKPI